MIVHFESKSEYDMIKKYHMPEYRSWILDALASYYPPGIFKMVYRAIGLMNEKSRPRTSDSILFIANSVGVDLEFISNWKHDFCTFNFGFKNYDIPSNRVHLNISLDPEVWTTIKPDRYPNVDFYCYLGDDLEFTNPNQKAKEHTIPFDSGSCGLWLVLTLGYTKIYLLGFGKQFRRRTDGTKYKHDTLKMFKSNRQGVIRGLGKKCLVIEIEIEIEKELTAKIF